LIIILLLLLYLEFGNFVITLIYYMLYEFIQFMNKRYRIPKRQSRMEHPEKLAPLGTVDTGNGIPTLLSSVLNVRG
jgi:hypothetical protein